MNDDMNSKFSLGSLLDATNSLSNMYGLGSNSSFIVTNTVNLDDVNEVLYDELCKDLCPYSNDCVKSISSGVCVKSIIMDRLKSRVKLLY